MPRNAKSARTETSKTTMNKVSNIQPRFNDILEQVYDEAVKREYTFFEYINVVRTLSRKVMVRVKPDT